MPEGDTLQRAAARLQVLVGQRVEVETPHPRAAVKQLAERLDGRRLESVEAAGKNLLLRFEHGLVLRSHLQMTGRWQIDRRGWTRRGRPWLVLRGAEHEAVLWNGPVLELSRGSSAVRARRGAVGGAGLPVAPACRCLGSRAARRARSRAPAHARERRRQTFPAAGLPARWSSVPALRRDRQVAPAGRPGADRLLVPCMPGRSHVGGAPPPS